ncbi:uncharacterized protein ACNLHF_028263 isoform 1-T2 [Anomaloglossus baeobatrachus]
MELSMNEIYKMARSCSSMEDVYRRQECIFGSGYLSSCPSTKEEAENQLLIYSTRFLPSPIFKMERLMPTNREAQEKYLPFPLYEERPELQSVTPEEEIAGPMEVTDQEESEKEDTKKTPQQRNEVVISEPMKYQEVKDFEEDEKEDTKKKEKKGSAAKRRMVQNSTSSIQNQSAKRKRDQNQPAQSQRDQNQQAKRQRDQNQPAQRQRLQNKTAKRRVKKQLTQRQMIRQQSSIFNKISTNLRKIKNTKWTNLFKAMRR